MLRLPALNSVAASIGKSPVHSFLSILLFAACVVCPAAASAQTFAVNYTGGTFSYNFGNGTVGNTSTQTLNYSVAANTTIGSIEAVYMGSPNLDFTVAGGTCTARTYSSATTCNVQVSFTPRNPGRREGGVIFWSGANNTGTVVGKTLIYGDAQGPLPIFSFGSVTTSSPGVTVYGPSIAGQTLSWPGQAIVNGAGDIYAVDNYISCIFLIPANGSTPSCFATAVVDGSTAPGSGGGSAFIEIDGAGDLLFNDAYCYRVIIDPVGGSPLVALGQGCTTPNTPYVFGDVPYYSPEGVGIDAQGNIYLPEDGATLNNPPYSNPIVFVPELGQTQTASVYPGPYGYGYFTQDDRNSGGSPGLPASVIQGTGDTLYITDVKRSTIIVQPSGTGNATVYGASSITGISPALYEPSYARPDAAGNLYVSDIVVQSIGGNNDYLNRALEITPNGSSATGVVLPNFGSNNLSAATYIDGDGTLYFGSDPASASSSGPATFIKWDRRVAPTVAFSASTATGATDNTDGTKTVTITNIGNTALHLTVSYPTDFSAQSGVTGSCGSGSAVTVPSNGTCVLPILFTPQNPGTLSETITLTDDAYSTTQSVTVTGKATGNALSTATHFSVSATSPQTAGTSFNVRVTALSASNATVTGYTGTVHLTSSDGSAVLPGNSTLTSGVGNFTVTLKTAGNQTVTATDIVNGSITGASGTIAVSAGAATHFTVSAPGNATAGTAFNFTVTALDTFNNTATAYTGTVHLTSTDPSATLPANSTLTSGVGTLSATLDTAGSQTITATDTVTNSITGTSGTIAVSGAAPTVTTNPASQTVNSGNSATFTAAASGTPTPTVQWQVSSDGGATFSNVSGATSTTLSFTTSSSQNGNSYRAVFTNTSGSATTTAATLTVNFAPTVTTNPTSQSISAGSNVTFTAAASGNPTPTVQWQQSTNGGSSFTNIAGATSTTLNFTALASQNGNEYRAVFTNSAGTATTTAATLTVTAGPVVTTNPTNQTVNAGGTATFTAAATGTPTPTVQWQQSSDGGATFNNVAGATSTTLSFTTSSSQNGNSYRAVFTNTSGSATTTVATLTVNFAPTVTTNPTSQSISAGSNVSFTAAASGNPTPTVQWQVSINGGATFSNISGATATTLVLSSVPATANGNEYRAVFTNSAGTATTTAATLTVTAGPVVTTNPTNQTVNAGGTATFTAAATGTPTPTVQWQQSSDGGATFSNVAGATSTTLSFTTSSSQNGNSYRAVFTNTSGSATTTAATLTVNFAPTVTTNPVSQSISAGSNVLFTAAASGNPTPTVQWQVSTDGGNTFSNIAGATAATLSLTSVPVSANGNEYKAVFTNSVGTATTSAAVLTVNPVQVAVPNVVGDTQSAAATAITGVGLTVGTIGTASSSTVPSGSVISESPTSGTNVNVGSAVNIVVSTGPAQVAVPNVVGNTQSAATSAITGAGLTVGTIGSASSSTVPSGSVISQSPTSGTNVNVSSAVNIVVSTGPVQVAVPNVVGDTQSAATSAITGAGLTVGTVTTASSSTVPSGSVISQSPSSGTNVNIGSAVSLVVSTGTAPPVSLTSTSSISGSAAGGYVVTITVTNTGSGTVNAITLTTLTLGAASATNLPLSSSGPVAPGGTAVFTVTVPGSAGSDGANVRLAYAGTATGGTFSGSLRSTTLP